MSGKKLFVKTLVSLTALAIVTSATAGMSSPNGWYLEGNVGASKLGDTRFSGSTSTQGVGINVDLGYKFMPFLAAELGYTHYGTTRINAGDGVKAGTDKHYAVDVAGKAILPIAASGVELFGKLGAVRVNSSVSVTNSAAASSVGLSSGNNNKIAAYMALGGQYYFMPEFAANLQWARANGNRTTGKNDLYSVGLSFIFS